MAKEGNIVFCARGKGKGKGKGSDGKVPDQVPIISLTPSQNKWTIKAR